MLVANVLQRVIGFARNLAICHFLSQQQLGMWALASSFFVMGAPLAVLGLPGTFGRFAATQAVRRQSYGGLAVWLDRDVTLRDGNAHCEQ
jgi:O-antigen/teichoic acid export membrane protein